MSDLQPLQLSERGEGQPCLPFQPPPLFAQQPEFIKLYIGQLPLDLEQHQLAAIIQNMAPLKEVKIIKGDNTRGKFDLFCYAFATIKGNQPFAQDVIRRLQKDHPHWKMNIKIDHDRRRFQKPFQQPTNYPGPMASYPYSLQPNYAQQVVAPPQASQQKVAGDKSCNILVRQLWLGGIPEHMDKGYMGQLMSYYGIVEDIQMFPKFAFVKFKQAQEATICFERAEEVFQRLGSPQGFRIFFSDPLRRAYVVSNNYEYERQGVHVPIVFIGFPPVTSATVDMGVIKAVVEKFGSISAQYLRKNTNSQNRSYFLFTFDTVKTAIRVKQELSRRKDLLGDKRAEVAVLLDEEVIMKGRQFSHTQRLFQSNTPQERNRKGPSFSPSDPNMKQGMMPSPMSYPLYPQMYQPGSYMPPFYPPQPFYYEQPYYQPKENQYQRISQPLPPKEQSSDNLHDFLKDVLASDKGNEKKPVKNGESGRQVDILSKLLGNESKGKEKEDGLTGRQEERQPSWSGFLTWKGSKRVGVDGYSSKVEIEDYSINIISLIECKDLVLKDKNMMVLQASNSTGSQAFGEYRSLLRGKVGVAMNSHFLMYVMAKSQESDELQVMQDHQLLLVLEKASTLTLIKDRLIKSEELS